MINLYKYQQSYIESLRNNIRNNRKRLLLVAPTGSGKTVMFSYMVRNHVEKGGSALILTHRSELLTQAGGTFEKFEIESETIEASKKVKPHRVHVAMIETVYRRREILKDLIQEKSLIIIDEAHLKYFDKLFPYLTEKIVIGATATPYRQPKETQLDSFYQELVHEIDTPELIDIKKLNPARTYGVDIDVKGLKRTSTDYDTEAYYEENQTFKGVVSNYKRIGENKKTIVFSSNIKSSKRVCQEFVKNGYNARHVDGSSKDRKEIFDWFDKNDNAILCNCGIATAGFDQPDIVNVVLYRATTSLPLFLQMCGRGSRLSPRKKYFNILDFGGNIQRHGFWSEPRTWKMNYERKKDKLEAAPVKICKKCLAINRASAKECEICGYVFPKKKKTDKEVILERLDDIKGRSLEDLTVDELIVCQKSGRFKAPYIWRIVRTRGLIDQYAEKMNYNWKWKQLQKSKGYGFKNTTV